MFNCYNVALQAVTFTTKGLSIFLHFLFYVYHFSLEQLNKFYKTFGWLGSFNPISAVIYESQLVAC